MENNTTIVDDFNFLINLLPEWCHIAYKGLDPTMYGTGTYSGDYEVIERIKDITERYGLMNNKKD